MWWYDGGEKPADTLLQRIGSRLPEQGSIVVGTSGLLVLPHMEPDPFVIADAGTPSLPAIDISERHHYAEFIDAVLAGGRKPCSAGFDYAGPLTESVLIGNVAAHFPGETLTFDPQALRFPGKAEADRYLTREYRDGWKIKA
jgi:hypothetical protein